jgi:O-antigen/teichoic acid export membrane protein
VVNGQSYKAKTLHARIVSGSAVLLAGAGLTNAISLAYNIVIAAFLGPANFGHATVVYTLLTILSAVALSFQIVSAKVVAQQSSADQKREVYRVFHRAAWGCGLLAALVLLVFQKGIASYLNLPDTVLVALLAIGSAFYVPLGCRRGCIQGIYEFRRLAINMVVEGGVRLGGSYLLIVLGFGVRGVIAANAAAIAAAYFAIKPQLGGQAFNPLRFWHVLRETSQALFFFAGQMLITNCDIVLVKHLFSAEAAGLYAAVALVGRVISSFSSAVVNTMFPLVAGTNDEERKDLKVIGTALLLVSGIGLVMAFGLSITPSWMWTSFLGPGFTIEGAHSLSYLSSLYALRTVIYSLSVVFIAFEMSYKIANSSAVQFAFSGVVIAGIYEFHSSLLEVIVVQLVLLSVLVVLSAAPFLAELLSGAMRTDQAASYSPITLIRRASEDEVIAEFLKSDLNDSKLQEYRGIPRRVITEPNLEDAQENAMRRALMLIRHLALWKEVPAGTEWHEVKVNEAALDQVRIFPRAQWRRLARGDFSITAITEGMSASRRKLDAGFVAKVSTIRERVLKEGSRFGAVILLGLGENTPVTVLDGNHRLVAALLSSPSGLPRLRFMCGLSPRMAECCWYDTNVASLIRYGTHLLEAAIRNPKADLMRYLSAATNEKRAGTVANSTADSLLEAGDVQS